MNREGSLATRVTEEGVELTVYMMIMGQARLCVGEPGRGCYDKAWCYHRFVDAVEVAETWDGEGDKPPGPWYRDLQTGERREFDAAGNVTREYVMR